MTVSQRRADLGPLRWAEPDPDRRPGQAGGPDRGGSVDGVVRVRHHRRQRQAPVSAGQDEPFERVASVGQRRRRVDVPEVDKRPCDPPVVGELLGELDDVLQLDAADRQSAPQPATLSPRASCRNLARRL